MKLCCDSFDKIKECVNDRQLSVIIYGAGMIGQVVMPYIIKEYELTENLLFYVDGDDSKQGNRIMVCGKEVEVKAPEALKHLPKGTVILITNSNYSSVVSMLDSIQELKDNIGVIIPVILAENAKKSTSNVVDSRSVSESEIKIPKKIHYCWFSGSPLPDYLKKCIESWHKFCPDYEIKRWDESNYDVSKNPYMKQAYEAKKWGFVPDYARLDILYNHGGFYLDTDVELIKSLDGLRDQGAFCGVEKWGNINMGGCSGAVPHHPMIKRILDSREGIPFKYDDGTLNLNTCGVYETAPFIELGMRVDNTTQRINDMTVFSSDYFHPYDYMSGETIITKNTYSIHHFNGGWLDEKSRDSRRKTMEEYKKLLHRMGYDYGEIQNISNNSGL